MALAKITLTCKTCGAKFEHRHTCYNRAEADRYEIWAKNTITECPECLRARKAAEKAARLADVVNKVETLAQKKLVTLTGTEKQVNWANKIRAEFIEKTLCYFNEADIEYDYLIDLVSCAPNASWWIDHKADDYAEIMNILDEKM